MVSQVVLAKFLARFKLEPFPFNLFGRGTKAPWNIKNLRFGTHIKNGHKHPPAGNICGPIEI